MTLVLFATNLGRPTTATSGRSPDERSEIRDAARSPDFALLHPGYAHEYDSHKFAESVMLAEASRMSRLHWIEIPAAGRIAISARPRADDWLETEVGEWKASGLDMVVSLLEREEVSELGLQREAEICRVGGIEFVSFPIPDRGVPEIRQALEIANSIANGIADGRSIAIHCRAGIGRSSVIAACALICSGTEASDALAMIKDARGLNVPDTDEQRDWILAFGKKYQEQ